jgi:hypothetical protein
MIKKHELRCSEVGFTLHSKLIGIMRDLRPFDLLHDVVKE